MSLEAGFCFPEINMLGVLLCISGFHTSSVLLFTRPKVMQIAFMHIERKLSF